MSSETREFRPYQIDSKLSEALRGISLRFGDMTCQADGNLRIEDRSFAQRPASIVWSEPDCFEQFKRDLRSGSVDSGFDPSLLALVVTVRSSYLKHIELPINVPLSQLDDVERHTQITSTPEGTRRQAFLADTHGAIVEIFIALRRTLAPKPFHPWRKSAWLARSSFRLRCEGDSTLFRPMPLDDAKRADLSKRHTCPSSIQTGYENTTFYVEFDSGCDLIEDLSETEVPILWVDEELLTNLGQYPASPVAELIQHQMVMQLISSVVYEFHRQAFGAGTEGIDVELDTITYPEVKGSIIGRIAKLIAGAKASDAQRTDIIEEMRKNPLVAVAWAESRIGLRASFKAGLVPKT